MEKDAEGEKAMIEFGVVTSNQIIERQILITRGVGDTFSIKEFEYDKGVEWYRNVSELQVITKVGELEKESHNKNILVRTITEERPLGEGERRLNPFGVEIMKENIFHSLSRAIKEIRSAEIKVNPVYSSLSFLLHTYIQSAESIAKNQYQKGYSELKYIERLASLHKVLDGFDGKILGWIVSYAFEEFAQHVEAAKKVYASYFTIPVTEFIKQVLRDSYAKADLSRDIRPDVKKALGISYYDPKEQVSPAFPFLGEIAAAPPVAKKKINRIAMAFSIAAVVLSSCAPREHFWGQDASKYGLKAQEKYIKNMRHHKEKNRFFSGGPTFGYQTGRRKK